MNQLSPHKNNKILTNQKAICVSIRFGNPRTGDCRNFGICKMEVFEGPIAEFQKKSGYALARLISIGDNIIITFEKSSMIQACQELYFGRGFFLIEAEVIVEINLGRRLEIESTTLKVGRYPVIETLTDYTVKF